MKKIYLMLLVGAIGMLAACQKDHDVKPDTKNNTLKINTQHAADSSGNEDRPKPTT